jgi:hypothetical protein
MVDIHLIASLQELLRLQAAEIRQVIRGIDETLVEVVNDIDALVGAASKSLCRIHQQFYLVVILLRYVIYLIGMEEEVIFVVAVSYYYCIFATRKELFDSKPMKIA